MLFNSWVFFVYAPIVLGLYFLIRNHRAQNIFLLAASYVFYGAWDWRFLFLLFFSTVVDYFISLGLGKTDVPLHRKILLGISITVNLTVLGFFKYFDFFVENAERLIEAIGYNPEFARLNLILPVGISFYTFQTISYTVDVYWKKIQPERDFLDYALFVAFFPQLVAGPIERAGNLIPQLKQVRMPKREHFVEGAWLIALGCFKKIIVADNLSVAVDGIMDAEGIPSGMACLLAAWGFTFVAYGDFAGYSDIARGTARLMGVNIILNFNLPLIARNPSDFWRRWHISLSYWFRDYVYIPLGGSRFSAIRTYLNLNIIFMLSGLWHGAQWYWVIWGLYNGVLTSVHRHFIVKAGIKEITNKYADVLIRIGYFQLTALGMLLIRAQDVGTVIVYVKQIFTDFRWGHDTAEILVYLVFFVGTLSLIEAYVQNSDNPERRPGWGKGVGIAIVTLMVLMFLFFTPPSGQPFIYFQF